ncbi:hypothetical protein NMG60_11028031 [Bertholletia excelsa]
MEAENTETFLSNGMSHENGVDEQFSAHGEGSSIFGKVNGFPANDLEISGANANPGIFKLEDGGTSNLSNEAVAETSNADVKSNVLTDSKEVEPKETDQPEGPNPPKVQGKPQKEKPSSFNRAAMRGKKNKDGKDVEKAPVQSNGALDSNSRPKQPSALRIKSRSFNDRGVPENSPTGTPAVITACVLKQSGKSDTASPTRNATKSECQMEKANQKPLKKGPPSKDEANAESTSPRTGDSKPQRVGTLPTYSFNFRCNERAEKRKEFYSKLEEKIHAMELEKSNLQARTKETQEAEIKMLRKTLTFKATPMPSFYQEPPPPKPDLKKIPPTRAKSPKLGRKKNSPTRDTEGENSHNFWPGRLSLDEKMSQNNTFKGSGNVKKPQRKSLPKLPSEKTVLSNKGKAAASQKGSAPIEISKAESHLTALPKETPKISTDMLEQEEVPGAECSHPLPNRDVQDQEQTALRQEPIALEN